MAVSETATPPDDGVVMGELQVLGFIHKGLAVNCLHVDYNSEGSWVMKQFLNDEDLHAYARKHRLIIVKKELTA